MDWTGTGTRLDQDLTRLDCDWTAMGLDWTGTAMTGLDRTGLDLEASQGIWRNPGGTQEAPRRLPQAPRKHPVTQTTSRNHLEVRSYKT